MLCDVFAAHSGREIAANDDLETALALLVATCRATFPEIAIEPARFVAHVAARWPAELGAADWLTQIHAEDSYLACACLAGDRVALDTFEHQFAELRRVLRDDDARQVLRQRLFVAGKLATYSGKGPLKRWLRVVASRLAMESKAAEPIADDWQIAALPVAADDPELAYLKAHYRDEYARAFTAALTALDEKARTVLAQYHVDGLTIDELGALYRVHRVTASRWITKTQARLRDLIVEQLRHRLGLSTNGLRSVTRMVRSQLEVTLARALGATSPAPAPP